MRTGKGEIAIFVPPALIKGEHNNPITYLYQRPSVRRTSRLQAARRTFCNDQNPGIRRSFRLGGSAQPTMAEVLA